MDEFSEYGDLDMMMQYVKDVQTVQRKLADCTDSITFINEVKDGQTLLPHILISNSS